MTLADSMPVDVARERAKIDLEVLLEAGLVDHARGGAALPPSTLLVQVDNVLTRGDPR